MTNSSGTTEQESNAEVAGRFDPVVMLRDVQDSPEKLINLGVTSLAWLTHEAEHEEDDLTVIAIQNVLTDRPTPENKMYRDEYMRLWPQHAKSRNYG